MREYYEGKVAAVTGGGSGIGLALCEMMLSLGAKAVVLADINEPTMARETARLDEKYPGRAFGVRTDVASQESVQAMVKRAAELGGGRLDLLFNNAGLGLSGAFDDTSDADWKRAFDINFYGALYGIRAALPIMRAQGGGQIANTASGIAYVPMPYQSMYSATKSALLGLTTSLRYELWDENIRLPTIIPGTVATSIWGGGPIPDFAITPDESARGILNGLAANERVIFVTDMDRQGATHSTDPRAADGLDKYLLDVARKRRAGTGLF